VQNKTQTHILDPLFRLYFPSANVQESPQRIRSKSASCLSLISEDVHSILSFVTNTQCQL